MLDRSHIYTSYMILQATANKEIIIQYLSIVYILETFFTRSFDLFAEYFQQFLLKKDLLLFNISFKHGYL